MKGSPKICILTLPGSFSGSPLGQCCEELSTIARVLFLKNQGNIKHRDFEDLSPCLNYGPNQPCSLGNFTSVLVNHWENCWGRWQMPSVEAGSWVPAGSSLSLLPDWGWNVTSNSYYHDFTTVMDSTLTRAIYKSKWTFLFCRCLARYLSWENS